MNTIVTIVMFLSMTFNVFQQPNNKPLFVGNEEITQYSQAHNIGLLAHNYGSGEFFDNIKIDDSIFVFNNEGVKTEYVVTSIYKYEKLGNSLWQDLETDNVYTERFIWDKFYGQENSIVLQTCIEQYGNYTWGLLFIVAQQERSLE